MKYLKLYEEFDFDTWQRLSELGLADEIEIYDGLIETPNYAFGMRGLEYLDFLDWAEEKKGVKFNSKYATDHPTLGGQIHGYTVNGPAQSIDDVLAKIHSTSDKQARLVYVKKDVQRDAARIWKASLNRKRRLAESSSFLKQWQKLEDLGLIDSEPLDKLRVNIRGYNLLGAVGEEGIAELERFAREMGLVRLAYTGNTEPGLMLDPAENQVWLGPADSIEELSRWMEDRLDADCKDCSIQIKRGIGNSTQHFLLKLWKEKIRNGILYNSVAIDGDWGRPKKPWRSN